MHACRCHGARTGSRAAGLALFLLGQPPKQSSSSGVCLVQIASEMQEASLDQEQVELLWETLQAR